MSNWATATPLEIVQDVLFWRKKVEDDYRHSLEYPWEVKTFAKHRISLGGVPMIVYVYYFNNGQSWMIHGEE